MPTYGVTPQGFLRKPVRAILADIEASQRGDISQGLDLSSSSPWGQNNGIFSNELGIAWEILEVCYHAFDPDMAKDFLLTSLSKMTGAERRAAGYSFVTLDCELDEGVTLEPGVHYASVDGDSASLWTPAGDEGFTAPSTGTHAVKFRSENTGPVPAQPNTITVRQTAIAGWHSVTNPLAAQVGRNIDTDGELRTRREQQLATTGSATARAIQAKLIRSVDDIISCHVFENETSDVVDGMPPNSVEALVFDGEEASVPNNRIAQIIWENKAGGIQTVGNTSGTATDDDGQERTVYFSRPEAVPVYIAISIVKGPQYDATGGDAALAAFMAGRLGGVYGVGDEVDYRHADSVALHFVAFKQAVAKVTAFAMGTTPIPYGSADIPIGTRQIASFDPSRIAVSL